MAEKKGVGHAYNVDFLNVVFEAARADKKTDQNDEKRITDQANGLHALDLAREDAEAKKAAIQKDLAQYTGKLGEVNKQLADMSAEQNRLRGRLNVIAPSALKDYFRNAPL